MPPHVLDTIHVQSRHPFARWRMQRKTAPGAKHVQSMLSAVGCGLRGGFIRLGRGRDGGWVGESWGLNSSSMLRIAVKSRREISEDVRSNQIVDYTHGL